LVLFLGSTIGNFDRNEAQGFVSEIRAKLAPGDHLLLSTDLVKPIPRMLAAYDDEVGVTAAFNRNVLCRINRELDADLDLSKFRHVARYDEAERRIEMHLESTEKQTARIPRAGLIVTFDRGESIWTESSHKFTSEEVVSMAEKAGFVCDAQWVDEEWPLAQSLLRADPQAG
jgi:uncharacterized SAM-dependent methyltransferase